MIIQPIVNIAEICVQHKIEQAVICPGSRSAALTLAFARHPKIETFVIPDERSAGFIALGLSQSSSKPVVIVCTSGTAAANLYPSIIEAYYQKVPLLILTADRPPEWVDQQDGQTIRQQNIFQNHVLASYQFPVSFDHDEAIWHSEKMISEAIIKTSGSTSGPVHVNVPIREPFYPSTEENYHFSDNIKIIKSPNPEIEPSEKWANKLIKELHNYDKILVVVGQTRISEKFKYCLNQIQKKSKWVMVGDITSNISSLDHSITKHDIILEDIEDYKNLKPDLLITFGQGVLSKSLKTFIRKNPPAEHWNVGINEEVIDPFKTLSKKVRLNAEMFFSIVSESSFDLSETQSHYFNHWYEKDSQSTVFLDEFLWKDTLSEFHVVNEILKKLPNQSTLHLSNSMPVRYANYLGIENKKEIQIWANRGTSGIDGCTSTAVGHAIAGKSIHTLISGDLAFFYDRNGLWHSHLPSNLRVVVLNNHGGGIFRQINGPKQLKELEEFFETNQKLTAANTARDFGMKYFKVKTIEAMPGFLEQFFDEKGGASILEIETDPKINQQIFEDFKQKSVQLWN